jgi:SAM-dependent methyltransferase
LRERWYPETRVGGFTLVDGTVAFYDRINSVLERDFVVLDLGCGRGSATEDPIPWRRRLQVFKGRCARVIGADVDPVGESNPLLDEFRLIEAGKLPMEDESVDLCIADAVLEHVADVDSFFSECARVLKVGGYLFIRTPNAFNYATIITRLIPNDFHTRVLRRVQPARREEDVFPTLYRCNTVRALRATLERHGFDAVVKTFEAEPAYLSFAALPYLLGVLHQRYAPQAVRRTIYAFAVKEGTPKSPRDPGHKLRREHTST